MPRALDLTLGDDGPTYRRIARALVREIGRGRLRPGHPLPGTRPLAESLGVHRNTVIAAYRELVAEGWAVTEEARGTFVAPDFPVRRRAERGARVASSPSFALPPPIGVGIPAPQPPLSLGGGVVDVRLAPRLDLARAYRRALLRAPKLLRYGDPRGHDGLRAALATLVTESRGVVCSAEQVMVTRGSQMATALVARTLFSPGDVVAVEALGYPPTWAALRAAGAELVPVPVDEGGLVVEAVAAIAAERRVRAVVVTPHHQYPTTVTLSAPRRLALLALARRERMIVIEDDYDHEFHYEGRPVLPIASEDSDGVVVYVGTFSKVLAPGLRTGFVVAPSPVIERLAEARVLFDRQGDLVLEAALAELLTDGTLERHIRRVRRVYRARRDAFVVDAARVLGGLLSFDPPRGGTAIWARAEGVDIDALAERARDRGVPFQPGSSLTLPAAPRAIARAASHSLRLGFVSLGDAERARALAELARAAKDLPKRPGRG